MTSELWSVGGVGAPGEGEDVLCYCRLLAIVGGYSPHGVIMANPDPDWACFPHWPFYSSLSGPESLGEETGGVRPSRRYSPGHP